MSWRGRVVWSQGMFLQPQHFQQETRYLERLVEARALCQSPFAWGFTELQLDESLLATGKLGLLRAVGVLPDGTPFAMPALDPLPSPIELGDDVKSELIALALPPAREGQGEFDFEGIASASPARYEAVTEEVRDSTLIGDDPVAIQTGRLRLRLRRAREAQDGDVLLGVARVEQRRPDGMLVLERGYIAPQVRLEASGQLAGLATLLHGLLRQRSHLMAGRMGHLSHGVSEVADFLMLQTINRNEPVFAQHAGAPSAHPRELHHDCLALAGDLATLANPSRRPNDYPVYRHDDLQHSFAPLVEDLRSMLSVVLETHAQQIELVDRRHGVRTAVVNDLEMMRKASFVLAVNAQMPGEQLRQRFTAQTKVGPPDKIRDLVNMALPGVPLRSLPVAPRQLPYHAGFYYFELERGGELWRAVEGNGNLAMHVAGEFPGLELELWAIRQ